VNAATYTPLSATPPKRGIQTYACMLRWIKTMPMTSREVADHLGLSKFDAVVVTLRWLHSKGVIHIHGWRVSGTATQGLAHEVWGFGAGTDAPAPRREDGTLGHYRARKAAPVKIGLLAFAILCQALALGTDLKSAVELTGCDRSRLGRDLKFMRSIRLIRIAEWIRNPFGSPTPIYRFGSASSVGRPRPRTREETLRATAAQRREKYHATKLLRADPLEHVAIDIAGRTDRAALFVNQPA